MAGYKSWKEKRAADLDVEQEPGNWEYLDLGNYSDWYHLPTLLQYIEAAEKYGIDPVDYVALGISESGLGNTDPGNPSRIYWSKHPSLTQLLSPTGMMPKEEDTRKLSIDFGAEFLADKFEEYPDDRLKALQAYSGTGKTIYGGHPDVVRYHTNTTKSFGRPYQEIDYWKEQPQAKRIDMIAETLKTLPELHGLFPERGKMNVTLDDLINGLRDPKFDYFNYMVNKYAQQQSVDPNILKSMLVAESHLDPNARSNKGAVGLAQLTKETAKSVGVKDRTNPEESIMGGATYLKQLLDRFGSLDSALAAYNMGPTKFSKGAAKKKKVPKQVKNYVSKVKGMAENMGKPQLPFNMAQYLTRGVNPSYRGQRVMNPDGTMSSEVTGTFEIDDKFYNIPTIQHGLPLSNDEAVRRFLADVLPAVGVADTEEEANALAGERTEMLSNSPVISQLLDYLNIQR